MKFKNNKTVKMKKLKYYIPFIFLALVVILTFPGCKEEPPVVPPPPPPEQKDSIVVSIEDVTHRSISLSLQLTVSNRQSKNIKLFRVFNSNEYLVAEYPATVTDTTIIDDDNGTGLLLDTTYSYYALSIDSTGNVKDTSNTAAARTLAPTTHNYTWTEYTIGEWQSALYDVWGTDENNVWACGGVRLNDTMYGVIKWDGIEWKPEKRIGGLQAIYGFSETDIWTVGGGVWHYDGNEWISLTEQYPGFIDNIPYTSIWGTSSSNLYLGNQWGKIIHWDGEKATDVGIDADDLIADIRGFSENEIYAVAGTEVSFDRDQLYYFDGNTWQVIKEADTFPNNELLAKPLLSVYGRNSKDLYLAGRRIYRRINDQWLEEGNFNTIHQKIRGRNSNNIVAVGNQSTIYHYNGVDWLKLEPTGNTNIKFNSVFVTQRKMFVVGRNSSIAFIYVGENF